MAADYFSIAMVITVLLVIRWFIACGMQLPWEISLEPDLVYLGSPDPKILPDIYFFKNKK